MAENTNTEREAFESALIKLCAGFGEEIGESDLDRTPSGAYVNGSTEVAWMLWQARASLSLPAAGQEPVATDAEDLYWRLHSMSKSFESRDVCYQEDVEGGAYATVLDAMNMARSLYAAPQPAVAAPYSMDTDPNGIRALVADTITGALAFGAQGVNKPPEGHWLTPFWESARASAQPAVAAGWPLIARALDEWHEDDGPVMWWAWNGSAAGWAGEPAWCGTPNSSDWPGYHTHWTPHPALPPAPSTEGEGNG